MTKKKLTPKTQESLRKIICIHHEDDMTAFMAPKKARMATATMDDLESLYGPQQVITRVFHKRRVSAQEQFLVRWTPTFMLKPHIQKYRLRKALYEPDIYIYIAFKISRGICTIMSLASVL